MHYPNVTDNYAWYPWNADPSKAEDVPERYRNMVVQPLGDRQTFYNEMIQGCVDYYGKKGHRCIDNEKDRVEMSLRQPKVSIY